MQFYSPVIIVCVYHVPGRVHAAAVSGIDSDKCFVAVEWFENEETKGKEVSAHYIDLWFSSGSTVVCGAMWNSCTVGIVLSE